MSDDQYTALTKLIKNQSNQLQKLSIKVDVIDINVEELKQDVTRIDKKLDVLDNKVNTLDKKVDSLTGFVSQAITLSNEVNDNRKLERRVTKLEEFVGI